MFQYIVEWWYVLTIVLVACIAWYIAYYTLEIFAARRYARATSNKYNDHDNENNDDNDTMNTDMKPVEHIEHTTVTTVEDEDGNDVIIIEKEEVTITADEQDESDQEDVTEINSTDDDVIVAQPSDGTGASTEVAPKKHKVKNIAEGMSREDILQDKHEKNLQKVKYEAVLFKQRNDMAGYEKKLIEGLILDPDDIDIYRQLADFYFSDWKYTKALSMFRKILTFDPNDHHALWQIGEIYIEQWQYEDAQVFVEKALSLSPDNPKYYISLIDICIAKSDFPTALIYLEKIVALRPRNIAYLIALGEMYEKLWRIEEAKQTYFRVLEIDPLHTDVKHMLKKF